MTTKQKTKRILAAVCVYAAFISLIVILRLFLITFVEVSGSSMYDTFNSGDFVLGTKVHETSVLKRGDIVIFKRTDNEGKVKRAIKRIAGVPGDTVNGVTVQEGELYVLGDNSSVSIDSRAYGPIKTKDVQYKYAGVKLPHWSAYIVYVVIGIFAASTFCPFPERGKGKRKKEKVGL